MRRQSVLRFCFQFFYGRSLANLPPVIHANLRNDPRWNGHPVISNRSIATVASQPVMRRFARRFNFRFNSISRLLC